VCEIPLASGPFWATVRYVYLVNLGGVTELFVIESCAVSPARKGALSCRKSPYFFAARGPHKLAWSPEKKAKSRTFGSP